MATPVGSSGTLIGTALEAVGFQYQSYLLDVLAVPFTSSIGTFIYLTAAIMALVSFATSGGYKMGLWLLLGPGLFFASVYTRTETTGPQWNFGGNERPADAVAAQVASIQGVDIGFNEPARVSSLFATYDDMISRSTREFVRVINAGRENADFKFIVRAELLAGMRNKTVDDPGLKDLIHHAFILDCREALEAGRQAQNPANSEPIRKNYQIEYDTKAALRNKSFSKPTLTYLAQLKVAYPQAWNAPLTTGGKSVEDLLAEAEAPIQVPNWDQQLQKAQAEIESQNGTFSCDDIWNFVFAALHRQSKEVVESTLETAVNNNIPRDEIIREFSSVLGIENIAVQDGTTTTTILYKTIAQYMLRNEVETGSMSAFVSNFVGKDELESVMMAPEPDVSATERARVSNKEWQEKTRLMMAAAQLPYYQGIVLYVLAALYPFFALLLLIPGKHAGFLLWFILWLWAKSWDIGYAVVMLLDDVLFSLMSDSPKLGTITELDKDMGTAFNALREMDPTFQLSTYYSIMATAVGSIPMISSYLILGSLKGGAGLISAGMNSYSDSIKAGALDTQSQPSVTGLTSMQREQRMGEVQAAVGAYANSGVTGGGGENSGEIDYSAKLRGTVQWDNRTSDWGNGADLGNMQVASAAFQGLADGLSKSSTGDFSAAFEGNTTGNTGASQFSFLGRTAAAISPLAGAGHNYLEAMRSNRIDLDAQWANYDGTNSREVQALASRGVVYGQMLIPWAQQTAASKEIDFEITRLKQNWGLVNAGIESISGAVEYNRPTVKPYKKFSVGGAMGYLAAPLAITAFGEGWVSSLTDLDGDGVSGDGSADGLSALKDRLRTLKSAAADNDPTLEAGEIDSMSEAELLSKIASMERKAANS